VFVFSVECSVFRVMGLGFTAYCLPVHDLGVRFVQTDQLIGGLEELFEGWRRRV
jgi:hypothetical protein